MGWVLLLCLDSKSQQGMKCMRDVYRVSIDQKCTASSYQLPCCMSSLQDTSSTDNLREERTQRYGKVWLQKHCNNYRQDTMSRIMQSQLNRSRSDRMKQKCRLDSDIDTQQDRANTLQNLGERTTLHHRRQGLLKQRGMMSQPDILCILIAVLVNMCPEDSLASTNIHPCRIYQLDTQHSYWSQWGQDKTQWHRDLVRFAPPHRILLLIILELLKQLSRNQSQTHLSNLANSELEIDLGKDIHGSQDIVHILLLLTKSIIFSKCK